MPRAVTTRNHEDIRSWVEARGGRPAELEDWEGRLSIDFGDPQQHLHGLTWDQFFERFDQGDAEFLYLPDDETSRFYAFIPRPKKGS